MKIYSGCHLVTFIFFNGMWNPSYLVFCFFHQTYGWDSFMDCKSARWPSTTPHRYFWRNKGCYFRKKKSGRKQYRGVPFGRVRRHKVCVIRMDLRRSEGWNPGPPGEKLRISRQMRLERGTRISILWSVGTWRSGQIWGQVGSLPSCPCY